MASAIEDVSSLPGETLNDQDGRKIGEIKEIYGVGDDGTPMWVTVESDLGIGKKKKVFLPLARIKQQGDEIRAPYSFDHVHEAPDVEEGDELSEEDDRALRDYYAIGLADQEMVDNRQSYASQVPDEEGPAKQIDASEAEGPVRELDERPSAERAAEAYEERRKEQGDEEHEHGRKATAADVMDEDGSDEGSDDQGKDEADEGSDEKDEGSDEKDEGSDEKDEGSDEKNEQPKAEHDESSEGEHDESSEGEHEESSEGEHEESDDEKQGD